MKNFLAFIAGVGVGIAIAWTYNKNKYEDMVQEEVESLRDMKKKKEEPIKESEKEGLDTAEEIYEEHLAKEEAKKIINYNNYSKIEDEEDNCGAIARERIKNPIHVITPEEFASEVGYDTDTFYIFENDIVANDNNEEIKNVEEMFALTVQEIRGQFGIYEDDSVYVRDEKLQMDYEILRELENYEKGNDE